MQFKELLILLLVFFTLGSLQAGHELGGMIITYKSAPGSANNPLRYEVTAYSIYDNQGISAPPSINIGLQSSCFSNQTISLSRNASAGGSFTTISGLGYCTGNVSGGLSLSLAVFKGIVVLPGTCANFRFFTSSCCGRYGSTNNISSGFSNTDYFYADLNNTISPNSSPELSLSDFIRLVCPNKALNLYNFSEADGDSVYYSLSAPTMLSGSTVSNQSYQTGYSVSNQVGSSTGFTLNSATGAIQTQVQSSGQYAITIMYEEFRPDALGVMTKISEGRFTPILGVANSCTLPAFNAIYAPMANPDSLDCGAQIIRFSATRKVSIASLSPDGSEVSISSQKNGSLTVNSVQLLQDSILEIQLAQPLSSNDVLQLALQNGTDGDGIISVCGQSLVTSPSSSLTFYTTPALAPVASFSNTNNFLNVSFNSTGSSGNSFSWNFGDGSPSSNDPSPVHNYTAPGQYSVSLITTNLCGESDTLVQLIDVCDTLGVSDFNATVSGQSVTLTATGTLNVGTFYWNMGDGTILTGGMSTTHTYTNPGSYTVEMIASNACNDSVSIVKTIDVCDSLSANFTSQQSGTTVTLNANNSSAGAIGFYWNLGDGNTATGPSVTHTYGSLGNYYINLIVVNACGDSASFADSVKLCQPAVPQWSYSIVSSGANGLTIQFDASASQNATSYQWNFGDGNSGSGVNPVHTYATISLTYMVKLTVFNECGESDFLSSRLDQVGVEELTAENTIHIFPNPVKDRLVVEWDYTRQAVENISLFDLSGKKVLEHEVQISADREASQELDLSALPTGLYIIQLQGGGKLVSREKLLIQP